MHGSGGNCDEGRQEEVWGCHNDDYEDSYLFFFNFTTWSLVQFYRHFGGTYCLMFAIHDDRTIFFGNVGELPPDDAPPREEIRYAVSSTRSATIRLHTVAFPNTGILLYLCLSQLFPLPSSIVFIFGVNGFAVWRSIRRVVALTIPQGGHFSLSLSSTLPHLVLRQIILYSIFRTPSCTSTG